MKTVIHIIRETMQDDLGPDLVAAIPKISAKSLKSFALGYQDFSEALRLPTKSLDHLRPHINYGAMHTSKRIPTLRLDADDFQDSGNGAHVEDAIKLHLLYCHSVAIHDSLPLILDHFRLGFGDSTTWRSILQNYLGFLNQVKPLIEEGALVFIDNASYQRSYINAAIARGEARLWPPQLMSDVDETQLASTLNFTEVGGEAKIPASEAEYLVDLILESASETFVASAYHGGALDLYFPARLFRNTLRGAMTAVGRRLRVHERELLLLQDLLSVPVPDLADLNPSDVAGIRRDEETFEKWRRVLGRGLERMAQLDPALMDREQEALRVIREEIADSKNQLEDRIKRSQVLSKIRRGVRTFTIGAMAALALSRYVEAGQEVALGGVAVTIEVLLSFLLDRTSRGQRALIRHYLLFESSKPR